MNGTTAVTRDPDADQLVNTNAFALVTAMLLEERIRTCAAYAQQISDDPSTL
jgi:hypothetical protein